MNDFYLNELYFSTIFHLKIVCLHKHVFTIIYMLLPNLVEDIMI